MEDHSDRNAFLERGIDEVLSHGDTALDRLCTERPELADQLREKIATLRSVGLIRTSERSAQAPEVLGQYRLIELLGRGGMGAVYVAEHTTLGRRVALKLIRSEQLYFPGARERFRRETEAIARLQVPGVVPILDVGEVDGVPYYAMELLPGVDLCRLLEATGRTSDSTFEAVLQAREQSEGEAVHESGLFEGGRQRTAARIAMRLARTLARVHEHGIVHRDIKPSNVMVDRGGRVTIVDFGLAHLADGGELTASGAMLGSLPYMAPEQVRGERALVGPRTDVYGIGITLHELVYLQPAFASGDQIDLGTRVAAGRIARRDGPRDLETIIACATDPDPSRRYESADALADDLMRFLEFRPIQRRPSGWALRAVRWGQRNRAAAIAAFAALLLAIIVPTAIAIERSATAGELEQALAGVRTERDKYERAITGVLHVLAEARPMLVDVAEFDEGSQGDAVRDLFRTMIAFYGDLQRFDPDRPALERSLILAQYREAELQANLGDFARAEQLSDAVLAERHQFEGAAVMRYELRMIRGKIFKQRGDYARAEVEWNAALTELETSAAQGEPDLMRMARGRLTIANMHLQRGHPERMAAARAAEAAFEAVLRQTPDSIAGHCFLANTRRLVAQILSRGGDRTDGIELLTAVTSQLGDLLDSHPLDRTVMAALANTEHVLAAEFRADGNHAAAIPHLERAVELRRECRSIWPHRPGVVDGLAGSLANLGSSLNISSQPALATPVLEEVRDLLLEQQKITPGVEGLDRALVKAYTELGSNLRLLHGPSEESHAMHERAVEVIEAVIAGKPDVLIDLHGERSAALAMCAYSHYLLGQMAEALEVGQRACSDMRRFIGGERDRPLMRRQLGQMSQFMAYAAATLGKVEMVEALLRDVDTFVGLTKQDVGYLDELLGADVAKALLEKLGK